MLGRTYINTFLRIFNVEEFDRAHNTEDCFTLEHLGMLVGLVLPLVAPLVNRVSIPAVSMK
jgi:hypothetical protein